MELASSIGGQKFFTEFVHLIVRAIGDHKATGGRHDEMARDSAAAEDEVVVVARHPLSDPEAIDTFPGLTSARTAPGTILDVRGLTITGATGVGTSEGRIIKTTRGGFATMIEMVERCAIRPALSCNDGLYGDFTKQRAYGV